MPTWCSEELVRLGASSGLLLVAGSFSSGKSTTSAACLKEWVDTHGGVAVTIEDPPEKQLQGYYNGGQIYQIDVRNNAFAEAIRASRRWAFRYLFLGEVRDQISAEELLQIAIGGPMVLTTIHAAGAVEPVATTPHRLERGYAPTLHTGIDASGGHAKRAATDRLGAEGDRTRITSCHCVLLLLEPAETLGLGVEVVLATHLGDLRARARATGSSR
jgi:hypothetical protein